MADPVISAKLIVLYRFMSHNFPRSKTMWFLANSSIWHTKMLLNLTIPHPTTCLNVFLWQFPSFSSCLEQRTVRNTRGPFLVLFSFMKEQVFVPKTPNIFAIIPDHLNSTVQGCLLVPDSREKLERFFRTWYHNFELEQTSNDYSLFFIKWLFTIVEHWTALSQIHVFLRSREDVAHL